MSGPNELSPGMVVADRYRLDQLLGIGGFGQVFAATGTADGARIALKVFDAQSLDLVGGQARFEREAELARRLDHPNVVRVLDAGADSAGTRFIAFELLQGRTLEQELGRWGAMRQGRAAAVTLEVLGALEAAHGIGIVHRDLKPANVFLIEPGDRVKVLDFGIAKSVNPNTAAGLTRDGTALGTPAYMALEQMTGAPVGPGADLFALGVVLLEMLIGRTTFAPDHPVMEIVRSRLAGNPVPVPDVVRQLALGPVVARATQLEAATRYQSASEMSQAIRAAVESAAFVDSVLAGETRQQPPTLSASQVMSPTAMSLQPGTVPSGVVSASVGSIGPSPIGSSQPVPGAALAAAGGTAPSALDPFGAPGGTFRSPPDPFGRAGGAAVHRPDPFTPPGPTMPAPGQFYVGAETGDRRSAPLAPAAMVPAQPVARSSGAAIAVVVLVVLLLLVVSVVGVGLYYGSLDGTDTEAETAPTASSELPREHHEIEVPPQATSAAPEDAPVVTTLPSCAGVARLTAPVLRNHLVGLGWRVTGRVTHCVGSMVNFRCLGPTGKGWMVESGGQKAQVVVIRFPSSAKAQDYVTEQSSQRSPRVLLRGGTRVLSTSLSPADAKRLRARVCR